MRTAPTFIDANIFLRHLVNDDPVRSPACLALFAGIEQGKRTGWTTDLVVAELVFILAGKRHYHLSRPEVRAKLLPLLALPGLKIPHKRRYPRVFALYTTYPKLSYVDCYNAALVESNRTAPELYSYDAGFDRIVDDQGHQTLTRVEPAPPDPTEE